MKRYKDCALLCLKEQTMEELICIVETICLDKLYKTERRQTCTKDDTLVVFMEKDDLPLSRIILTTSDSERKIVISNIVPDKKSGLSSLDYSTYNKILDVFKADVFLEINKKYKNAIEENQEDYTIQEIIPKSYVYLETWLSFYPLSGHPLDEHRWYDFLIALRNNKEYLSVSDFSKFIQENYNWSKTDLEQFELKFEEQIDLLEYYDEHREY